MLKRGHVRHRPLVVGTTSNHAPIKIFLKTAHAFHYRIKIFFVLSITNIKTTHMNCYPMKSIVRAFVVLAFAVTQSLAQTPAPNLPANLRSTFTLQDMSNGIGTSEILYGIPMEPGKVVGDPYLHSGWRPGAIRLATGKVVTNQQIRLNILSNELEVNTARGIKALPANKVTSFIMLIPDSVFFLNASEFEMDNGVKMLGYFQLISGGSVPAFKMTEGDIKQPTYNVQMDVGRKEARIIKKEKFYFLSDGKMREVSTKRKEFPASLPGHQSEIVTYMDQRKLGLKSEIHIRLIFDYLSGLMENPNG